MFQIRGLGAIDANKIGAGTLRRPVMSTGGAVETPTAGGQVVVQGDGGNGGYAPPQVRWGRIPMAMVTPDVPQFQPMPTPSSTSLPYPGQSSGGGSSSQSPSSQPPSSQPPIATNPTNQSEPAPAGTQVTQSAPPTFKDKIAGKGGWIALGLGIVALGAALLGAHAHTQH